MRCFARFDNSADNPNNPDPARAVTFGEQTNDEMLVGYMDVALDYQDLSVPAPSVKPRGDGQFDVTFRHRPPRERPGVQLAATFNKDFSPSSNSTAPAPTGSSPRRSPSLRAVTSTNTCKTARTTATIRQLATDRLLQQQRAQRWQDS